MRVLGAVLAGGASSRFGSDKALAVMDGETLLARAAGVLAPFVDEVVVVGRDGGVPDAPGAGLGPLGGIAGALAYGRTHEFASVVTIACDMPEVPGKLITQVVAEAPAYCSEAPVLGHWLTSLADDLARRLASTASLSLPCAGIHRRSNLAMTRSAEPWMPGRARHDGSLSVRRWANDIGATPIASPYPLRNINTPADLAS